MGCGGGNVKAESLSLLAGSRGAGFAGSFFFVVGTLPRLSSSMALFGVFVAFRSILVFFTYFLVNLSHYSVNQ